MKNEIIEKAIHIAGGQKQLAEKAGLSQAAIHKLYRRKSNDMRCQTAINLSKATGIPVSDFLETIIDKSSTR